MRGTPCDSNRRSVPIGGWENYLAEQQLRSQNAAATILATRERYAATTRPTDPSAPWLYGHAVLDADDTYGTRHGLVVQGDNVSRASLAALHEFAVIGRKAHHASHGGYDPQCDTCRRSDAVNRVEIDNLAP